MIPPIYFQFIFKKLLSLFLIIYISLLSTYFCLELLTFSSLPSTAKLFYYFFSLALSKADLLITLSLLLASIQTISSLKQHNELTALQTNGISKTKLYRPFFILALILTIFSYWNTEFGISYATKWKIKFAHKKVRFAKENPFIIKHLPDHTRVIYQQDESHIFDLYWIVSEKEILHCKTISFETDHYVGHFVDLLKQNPLGRFEKTESFVEYTLPFLLNDIKKQNTPPEKTSLSTVYLSLVNPSFMRSNDHAKFLTTFLYKIIHPWFPFLFMTAILSYLFSSTTKNIFLSFVIGILFYLFFYSMMKTFILMSENYFISPWITIILIPLSLQGICIYKLCKN